MTSLSARPVAASGALGMEANHGRSARMACSTISICFGRGWSLWLSSTTVQDFVTFLQESDLICVS